MRVRIQTLHSAGLSFREVSKRTGVPLSTVRRLSKSSKARRNHSRSGRPHTLTESYIRLIIRIARKNWEGRKLSWRKLGQEAGFRVSGKTIKRALKRYGYTRCKACKKPFISQKC
jgi:transposase